MHNESKGSFLKYPLFVLPAVAWVGSGLAWKWGEEFAQVVSMDKINFWPNPLDNHSMITYTTIANDARIMSTVAENVFNYSSLYLAGVIALTGALTLYDNLRNRQTRRANGTIK